MALVCAMTTSCSKEENNQSVKDQFYAAVDNSKISLTGTGRTNWGENDVIKVLGYAEDDYSTESIYKLVNGSGTYSGVFEHTPDLDGPGWDGPWPTLVHGPYMAFYPYGRVEFFTEIGGTQGESILTDVYFSSQQYYTGEGLPMFARSDTRQLTFSHMMSILKLHIQADNILLAYILVSAPDKNISGMLPVAYDADGNPYITPYEDGYPSDFSVEVGQSINDGLDVYMALPVGTYSSLRLDMFTDDDPDNGVLVCTKNLNSSFTFERNKLYPVTMEGLEFTPYKK